MAQHAKLGSRVQAIAVATAETKGRVGASETARNGSTTWRTGELEFVSSRMTGLTAALVDLNKSIDVSANIELTIIAEDSSSRSVGAGPVEQHVAGEVVVYE